MLPAPSIEPPAPREQLLTMADVAKWLRMSKVWVCRHSGPRAKEPVIPSLQCGAARRYRAADVERFIEEHTVSAASRAFAVRGTSR